MLIAACDPGKIRDSFGFVVIRVNDDFPIEVRTAKRWHGRDYADVERTIAKFHLKHNFDHIVVEQNNVGIHVVESLVKQYKLPIIAVTTSKDLKDNKKIIAARVMDKNQTSLYIAKLMKNTDEDGDLNPLIKFPRGQKSKDLRELERQVAIFAEHRTESGKGLSYYAPGQEHDDLAMAFMLAIHIAKYYLREDEETRIGAASKAIDYGEIDILGSGIPEGGISKGRAVVMP